MAVQSAGNIDNWNNFLALVSGQKPAVPAPATRSFAVPADTFQPSFASNNTTVAAQPKFHPPVDTSHQHNMRAYLMGIHQQHNTNTAMLVDQNIVRYRTIVGGTQPPDPLLGAGALPGTQPGAMPMGVQVGQPMGAPMMAPQPMGQPMMQQPVMQQPMGQPMPQAPMPMPQAPIPQANYAVAPTTVVVVQPAPAPAPAPEKPYIDPNSQGWGGWHHHGGGSWKGWGHGWGHGWRNHGGGNGGC